MYNTLGCRLAKRCKTCQSLRELGVDKEGIVLCFLFFCLVVAMAAVELDHLCGVENLNSAQGE